MRFALLSHMNYTDNNVNIDCYVQEIDKKHAKFSFEPTNINMNNINTIFFPLL